MQGYAVRSSVSGGGAEFRKNTGLMMYEDGSGEETTL